MTHRNACVSCLLSVTNSHQFFLGVRPANIATAGTVQGQAACGLKIIKSLHTIPEMIDFLENYRYNNVS